MTTFHDALTGQKRKLNIRERTPTVLPPAPYCAAKETLFWHEFVGDDEQAKCKHCGVTRLFVIVRSNMKKK